MSSATTKKPVVRNYSAAHEPCGAPEEHVFFVDLKDLMRFHGGHFITEFNKLSFPVKVLRCLSYRLQLLIRLKTGKQRSLL